MMKANERMSTRTIQTRSDAAARPTADDVQPQPHETVDRVAAAVVTAVPALALGAAAWQLWDRALHWSDIAIFALLYIPAGLGVTVGFHRHFTHRSFATTRPVQALLAILGSAAVEGGVIQWVANHRKHHAFSDQEGDPHSPHVGHGHGLRGALRGLLHAHVGWLFAHAHRAAKQRYAPDLIADPMIRLIDRTFAVWALAGLALPFALGIAIGGTVTTGLTGLLWGGAVRIFVLHHLTYSINSLCHFFGRRRFPTDDESRNLLWLALPSFGEAWHNNHHAFPRSAFHGLYWWQVDISGYVIGLLERLRLIHNVQRISPELLERRMYRQR
jgi:stearoyl-CoA desaturase (delta-9 desaturase)